MSEKPTSEVHDAKQEQQKPRRNAPQRQPSMAFKTFDDFLRYCDVAKAIYEQQQREKDQK